MTEVHWKSSETVKLSPINQWLHYWIRKFSQSLRNKLILNDNKVSSRFLRVVQKKKKNFNLRETKHKQWRQQYRCNLSEREISTAWEFFIFSPTSTQGVPNHRPLPFSRVPTYCTVSAGSLKQKIGPQYKFWAYSGKYCGPPATTPRSGFMSFSREF